MPRIGLLLALVACGKGASGTGSPELDEFDQLDHPPYEGAYASRSGVVVKRVLAIAAGAMTTPTKLATDSIVFDLDDQPGAVAFTLLRDLAGQRVQIDLRDGAARRGYRQLCDAEILVKPIGAPQTMSIEVMKDQLFLGLSRDQEFQDIGNYGSEPDWAKLRSELKTQKQSLAFVERDDLEIAVDPSLPSATLLHLLATACEVGFRRIAVLAPADLTAKAAPPAPTLDISQPLTAAKLIELLNAHAGPVGFEPRGIPSLCTWMEVANAPGQHISAKLRRDQTFSVGNGAPFSEVTLLQAQLEKAVGGKRQLQLEVTVEAPDKLDVGPLLDLLTSSCRAGVTRFRFL